MKIRGVRAGPKARDSPSFFDLMFLVRTFDSKRPLKYTKRRETSPSPNLKNSIFRKKVEKKVSRPWKIDL